MAVIAAATPPPVQDSAVAIRQSLAANCSPSFCANSFTNVVISILHKNQQPQKQQTPQVAGLE